MPNHVAWFGGRHAKASMRRLPIKCEAEVLEGSASTLGSSAQLLRRGARTGAHHLRTRTGPQTVSSASEQRAATLNPRRGVFAPGRPNTGSRARPMLHNLAAHGVKAAGRSRRPIIGIRPAQLPAAAHRLLMPRNNAARPRALTLDNALHKHTQCKAESELNHLL